MAQTSGFFNAQLDSQGNFDRVYFAEQFSTYFANFIGNGVFAHLLDKFVVTAGSGLSINVGTGKAFCKGYWFESDAQESLSIDLPDGLLNRKDNVVIRYDFTNRKTSIQVIKGTAATTPSAPEVVRNSLVFDLKIAEIFVGASISAISQSAITDTRSDNNVCGWVTGVVDQIDTTTLFTQFETYFQEWKDNQQADYEGWTDARKAAYNQFVTDTEQDYTDYTTGKQEEFNTWFQNVKDQLSTDAVGRLQEQINEHEALLNSLSQTQTQQASALTELDGRVDSLDDQVAANVQSINGLSTSKADKPTDPDKLGSGFVYQDEEGNLILAEGNTKPKSFKYTVIVDNGADGNPAAVTYADDAVGITPASGASLGGWSDFVNAYFKPCVIKPGATEPEYFLNPTNLKQKLDGTTATLTGADGDVMIQVGKLYGKFVNSGTSISMSISNVIEDSTWFCWNDIAGVEKDFTYRGRYMAGVASGAGTVMRSISGVSKLVNITRANGRTYATNRGTGYHQNNAYLLFLWQFMYLLLYKNRNSQTALGQGRTASSNTANVATGWSDNYGCCWGDQGGVNGVVFLWVEDFYGDTWEWVDGIVVNDKTYKLTRDPSKYNDTGDNFEISVASGLTESANNSKFIKKITGTNAIPFLPADSGGSETMYFCDYMWFKDSVQVALFGGSWRNAEVAGAFYWRFDLTDSFAAAPIGSRLCRG